MPRPSLDIYYILDDENHPVKTDLMGWAKYFENHERRVGYTQVTSEVYVSTVFLGIDHRHYFLGDGPPLIFETMIFADGHEMDNAMWRYSTWDDAEIGHKAAVRYARKALGQRIRSPPK